MLTREELIALVEDSYFFNVDNKNLEPAWRASRRMRCSACSPPM